MQHRGELAACRIQNCVQTPADAFHVGTDEFLADGDSDGDGFAVCADHIARGERTFERELARSTGRRLVTRGRGQQRLGVELTVDADYRRQREKIVDAFDKGKATQLVVQLFKGGEFSRCP